MRKFIVLLLLFASAAVLAYGLSPKKPAPPVKIGIVQFTRNNLGTLEGFKKVLSERGYVEGQNLVYLSEGPILKREQIPAALESLLAQKPDLIFASTTPASLAARRAVEGTSIPVIFSPVNDPVASGILENPQRPEGNVTGVRLALSDGRRLQSLVDIFPSARRVLIPCTPGDKSAEASVAQLQEAARRLDVSLVLVEFSRDFSSDAIADLIPENVDAILLPREGGVMSRTADFASAAVRLRLPLSAARYEQLEAGALLGYGFVGTAIGEQAARMADKILKGAPVFELPVETARDYLFINLATAERMDLAIPDAVLRRTQYIVYPDGEQGSTR